jgi:hypothetical protein
VADLGRWAMNPNERWPYLSLLAGHIFYLGDPADFHEIDRLELDRTEGQLSDWIKDVAGEIDQASLKERMRVAQHHRYPEAPDEFGRQAWLDYVFLFDRSEVLVEELFSYPKDVSQSPIRMRRFSRRRFAECGDEIKRLFST